MRQLSVLISFSGQGGVERMVLNLVREMSNNGVLVDLLLIRAGGEHLDNFKADKPGNVRIIELKAKHTLTCIPELVRYFREEKPVQMLVAKDRAGRAALIARKISGQSCRVVIRLGTNLSAALASKKGWQRWLRVAPMRRLYRGVDAVVAVSEGVRQDTLKITRLPEDRVTVIRNPVITPDFYLKAEQKAEHSWLAQPKGEREIPVVMAAGRFSYQKDFPSLLKAIARVNRSRPVRLIILGEGKDREALFAQASELGIGDMLDLPGYQTNPYSWLSQADVFVLSSRWEGSPNVLTEALALGIPSVSTACPSGPDEVLENGRYGPLVPVEDYDALADGILQVLNKPMESETLKQAVAEYTAERSAQRYLSLLGMN